MGKTAKTPDARWSRHILCAKNDPKYRFHKAISEHGKEKFVLYELTKVDSIPIANQLEKMYIGLLDSHSPDSGYNSTLGGDGCTAGDSTAAKISRSLTGRRLSESHCRNMGAARVGKKLPESTKQKMRESRVGRKPTLGMIFGEHTRRKMSESRMGRKMPENVKNKISKARTGISLSTETKERIRTSLKNYYRRLN